MGEEMIVTYETPADFHVISLHHYSHLGFSAHVSFKGVTPYHGTNRSTGWYADSAQEAVDVAVHRIQEFIAADMLRPRGPIVGLRPTTIDPAAVRGIDLGELDL